VAYKAGTSDMRESPALKIIDLLQERGGEVSYQDPYVPELREHGLRSVPLADATEQIDLAVIVTAHPDIDFQAVLRDVPTVVDLRGVTRKAQRANLHQL
jgi:UDP-N-acetyl-D-glucosamine dehydrogenase